MDIDIKKENFNRVARSRTQKVFRIIERLANCSNRRYYSYTPEQVEQLKKAIKEVLDKQWTRFDHPYRNKKFI